MTLVAIRGQIRAHPSNRWARELGYEPIYAAAPAARIVIVGQAPGRRAQQSGVPWNDRSGETLRGWLGIDRDTFYDPNRIALLPIDFHPGTVKSPSTKASRFIAETGNLRLVAPLPTGIG